MLAVGAGVSHVTVGERVLCPVGSGTHREQFTVKDDHLTPAPEGDAEQLALLALNPASALLMLQHVKLSNDDWIIQNAANSTVGRIVQQIAIELDLRVINAVKSNDVATELGDLGTTSVLIGDDDLAQRVSNITQGAPIRLALDAVGGIATGRLASCLAEGGTLIHHGALSGEACQVTHEILSGTGRDARGNGRRHPSPETRIGSYRDALIRHNVKASSPRDQDLTGSHPNLDVRLRGLYSAQRSRS